MGYKKVFVSFINDDGRLREGYFDLVEQTENYIKIKSGSNIITIPYHKLNKMKESF